MEIFAESMILLLSETVQPRSTMAVKFYGPQNFLQFGILTLKF